MDLLRSHFLRGQGPERAKGSPPAGSESCQPCFFEHRLVVARLALAGISYREPRLGKARRHRFREVDSTRLIGNGNQLPPSS